MKVKPLQDAARIVAKVTNKKTITMLHKCVELGPEAIRCCSEHGNCEYWMDIPDIPQPCLVLSEVFMGVVSSLPPDADISFALKSDKVTWKCGSASGQMTLAQRDAVIPSISHMSYPWQPPKSFAKALLLASSACQAMTVSVGLFGVVLEPADGMLRIASTNGQSLASSWIELGSYPWSNKVTLRPPVPTILSTLLDVAKESMVDITDEGVFVLSQELVAHLPLSPPLSYDLTPTLQKHSSAVHIAQINADAVKKFLSLASKLADAGLPFLVTIRVKEGQIVLEQNSLASASEQYFLTEGLKLDGKEFQTVALSGDLLAMSLGHATEMVMDFLDVNTLVFRGTEPRFVHIIGGRAK